MAGYAQNYSHSKAYLEEKVRDPQVREYLIKQIDGSATKADFSAIQAYYNGLQSKSSNKNKLIQEGAEPHIAIHPTNKNILALTFMQNSLTTVEYPIYTSFDGGTTWNKSTFSTEDVLDSLFPGSLALGGGDPILAFDKNGKLYLSYIYVHGNFPAAIRGDMFYVYSLDTGKTFVVPPIDDHVVYEGNLFTSDLLDRQWMCVDNTGGQNDGNLYLSAFYFGGLLNTEGQVVLTKPADSSGFNLDSVSTAVAPPNGFITQFGNIKVDQSGRVHVSCALIDEFTGGGFTYHTVSSNGGKTFSTPTLVGTGVLLSPNGGPNSNSLIHARENAAVSMDVDGDNIYVVWTDLGNSASKAFYSYSNNGGVTFSQRFEFGNQLLDTSTFHFMPNVSADSGQVTISWYSVDKTTGLTNYYMTESADSGQTFNSAFMVSDTSSTFSGGPNTFYGDYNSSVKFGCTTWSVWSDGRSGEPDVYVVKTRLCDSTGAQAISISELSPVTYDFKVGNIWPNPADHEVNIMLHLSKPHWIQVDIYDVQGRLVKNIDPVLMTDGDNELTVIVDYLAPSQYILKFSSDNGLFATRILLKY